MAEAISNTKKFEGGFLLWRKMGNNLRKLGKKGVGNPRFRHPTYEAAETEANRLLELFPESTFVILQEVAAVKNRDPNNVAELSRESILTCGYEITTYVPKAEALNVTEPWVDPDDAPGLDETWFEGADVYAGETLISKGKRDPSNFTTLDQLLDEDGIREEVTTVAKEKLIAEVTQLATFLKQQSVGASEAEKMFAEAKSLRQADNPEGRTDLYSWSKPEDTLYGKAATTIEFLLSRSDLKKPE